MCGEVDVSALLARLSPEQLDQWEAVDSIMPIGIDRICFTLALIGSELCRLQATDPNATFPWRAFMPWLGKQPEPEQTAEDQIARCRMIGLGVS